MSILDLSINRENNTEVFLIFVKFKTQIKFLSMTLLKSHNKNRTTIIVKKITRVTFATNKLTIIKRKYTLSWTH